MSATDKLETVVLQLFLENVDAANIGDPAGLQGSAVAGDFFISLHTASPGEAGDQTTNEATFGDYARQAVPRTGAGWSTVGNSTTNVAPITFPEGTSGAETITHFGIGSDLAGIGNLWWYGDLDNPIAAGAGVTISFAAGELEVTAD